MHPCLPSGDFSPRKPRCCLVPNRWLRTWPGDHACLAALQVTEIRGLAVGMLPGQGSFPTGARATLQRRRRHRPSGWPLWAPDSGGGTQTLCVVEDSVWFVVWTWTGGETLALQIYPFAVLKDWFGEASYENENCFGRRNSLNTAQLALYLGLTSSLVSGVLGIGKRPHTCRRTGNTGNREMGS